MEMEFNGDGDAVPGELLQLQDPGPRDLDAGPATMELFSGNAEVDSRPMERGTWPMDRS